LHFDRLRLHGFKSFVEPTDLLIEAGLTGIVGPNGCGKSNLVEALRWVMGETSPKRIRGSEMDDVIFAGTATRPSRNIAEVTLELDNTNRAATAEFNDADNLSVVRRIEREAGSEYRVNGRPVRQRDVQLLFADLATGAHSTSLVGQGQIDALIRAKPQDRRQILEEASGTAGLQARRHEAELKLKAAEQNLTRVDDVLNALDMQLRGLKQQVRQASRYRNLAEHIRRTEAALMHLRWTGLQDQSVQARDAFRQAESTVNELLAVVTRGNAQRADAAAELPALRQAEAAAAAIVQRLLLAREQLENEEQRIASDTAAQEQRLNQAQNDHAREQSLRADAEEAMARLNSEVDQLAKRAVEIEQAQPAAKAAYDAISEDVAALDSALHDLTEQFSGTEARRNALQREIIELESRRAALGERRRDFEAQRNQLLEDKSARADLALAQSMVDACDSDLSRHQQAAEDAALSREVAEESLESAREHTRETEAKFTKLQAEADALRALLKDTDHEGEKLINMIEVEPGLETALAAALGEALSAPLDANAAAYWRALPPYVATPPLPRGATTLTEHIKAPQVMSRALSQIGLVKDEQQGATLASELHPGQVLVSRDGWAWR